MPNVLNEQWLETHLEYSPDSDPFVAIVEQAFAEGAETFNGLTPADLDDLRRTYSLIRTGDELAQGIGWKDLAIGAVLENGPPLAGAVGQAHNTISIEAQIATSGLSVMGMISKAGSPVWKSFKPYRGGIKTNGLRGRRARYFTWDYRHSDIEVFDRNGRHLGSMDPVTGEMYKPPVPGRTLDR
jgi:hypothetical protein